MRYQAIVSLVIFVAVSLWAIWMINQNPAFQPHKESPYQDLDAGTQFYEKTGMLCSSTWRVCVTLPGRPTKIYNLPRLYAIAHVGCYEAPGISYLVGPHELNQTSCQPQDTASSAIALRARHNRREMLHQPLDTYSAAIAKKAKFQCREIVGALKGKETAGYPVPLTEEIILVTTLRVFATMDSITR